MSLSIGRRIARIIGTVTRSSAVEFSIAVMVASALAQPAAASPPDRIANMSRAVFTRSGGTEKGITQEKFKDAEGKIDDALDKLTADGVIGGETPPPIVIKRDLSKKDVISQVEFLHYFRGAASERDIAVRRKLVDMAIGQAGAAKAAADAAREQTLAQEAALMAQAANFVANQNSNDPNLSFNDQRPTMILEQQMLKLLIAELEWYKKHPKEPMPAATGGTPSTSIQASSQAGGGGLAQNGGIGIGVGVGGSINIRPGSQGVIDTATLQHGIGVSGHGAAGAGGSATTRDKDKDKDKTQK